MFFFRFSPILLISPHSPYESVKCLKKVLRHPRPVAVVIIKETPSSTPIQLKKFTYGMPSSHSAAVSFFATYSYFLLSFPWFIPFIIMAISVAWSRVKLGYHTWSQVGVGITVGISVALLWELQGWRYGPMEKYLKTVFYYFPLLNHHFN